MRLAYERKPNLGNVANPNKTSLEDLLIRKSFPIPPDPTD